MIWYPIALNDAAHCPQDRSYMAHHTTKPLMIDLFCGLGGWASGGLAEGYEVVGFDIERHRYPMAIPRSDHGENGQKSPHGSNPGGSLWRERSATGPRDMAIKDLRDAPLTGGWVEYPAQLVLQDVLTLHGSQFKDATLIVASPPCQAYSYRAMPWKRAKALPPPDNTLFEACFRIQREACEAAGRHIPLVVENVRGAQKWVGRARWNYGSFYLWGDVPALMPPISRTAVLKPQDYQRRHGTGSWFAIDMKSARAGITDPAAIKLPGFRFDGSGRSFQSASVKAQADGLGGYGGSFGWDDTPLRRGNSRSPARKAASAMIAKIPLPLSRHIAAVFKRPGGPTPLSRS
jgi:hypothetical protein